MKDSWPGAGIRIPLANRMMTGSSPKGPHSGFESGVALTVQFSRIMMAGAPGSDNEGEGDEEQRHWHSLAGQRRELHVCRIEWRSTGKQYQ